ncbi:MAG TPA: toll/interleukin-1 receptor domain-containing protein [Streptosporangiaceae bacterium]
MAGRIFISYRRADTANQAGWLAERLAGHYGRPQVVMDVDSIQLGNDFAEVIAAAVTSCDALLALIGYQWLAVAAGPDDFVRVEIESALTRGIGVIPVLVDGARMPTAAELPPGLAMLAQQPPLSLGAANPEGDVSRLTQVLDQTIAARSAQWQATQAGQAQNQPTVTGMAPSWGAPAIYASPGGPRAGPIRAGPIRAGPVRASTIRASTIRASTIRASTVRAAADRTRRFRARADQADAAAAEYLGDRRRLGRCRRGGDRGVHRHPQRPPRVVGVFVVRARVGVGGDGLAPQCLAQAQQRAERLRRGQGPPHGRLLHQQGRLGR